jgi:hypothetical protein
MQRLVFAFILLCLTACGGGAGSNSESNSAPTSARAVVEDVSSGLKGADANGNGIRDDVDRLIAAEFSQTPAVKKAAEQKAQALQAMLEASTKEQALVAGDRLYRASECASRALPENTKENEHLLYSMSKKLQALTANTRERLTKYFASNKMAGGGVFSNSSEIVCD